MNISKFMAIVLSLAAIGSLSAGCGGKRSVATGTSEAPVVVSSAPKQIVPHKKTLPDGTTDRSHIIISEGRIVGSAVRAMPNAVVYRMSGDYAANVPVNIVPDGTLVSYPAPSDVSEASMPLAMTDGWWLDRRGISKNSVFTRYTYGEYSALEHVPSRAELLAAVIPGARVTEIMQLPMTPSEAVADTAAVNDYIRAHAPSVEVR